MRIIAKRPHVKDCFMVGGQFSPWCLDFDKPHAYGDKRGRLGFASSHGWVRLRCNDPKCTALALVHHWDLSEMVHEALT